MSFGTSQSTATTVTITDRRVEVFCDTCYRLSVHPLGYDGNLISKMVRERGMCLSCWNYYKSIEEFQMKSQGIFYSMSQLSAEAEKVSEDWKKFIEKYSQM